jgi:hypothetical protein
MPGRYLIKSLLQTATYWASPIADGYGGYTFTTPVTIDCRWLLKQELFIDAKGKEKVSAAVVLLGQDVSLGGYLYLGTSTESNPKDVDSSFEIRGFAKIPDIKGTSFLRKAWL